MAEQTVSWKALADFSKARREADRTAASLANLRREQEKLNAVSAASGAAGAGSFDSSSIAKYAAAAKDAARQTNMLTVAQQRQVAMNRELESSEQRAASGADTVAEAISRYQKSLKSADSSAAARGMRDVGSEASAASRGIRDAGDSADDAGRKLGDLGSSARKASDEVKRSGQSANTAGGGFGNFVRSLRSTSDEWSKATKAGADMRWELVKTKLTIAAAIPVIDVLAAGLSNLAAGAVGMAGALAPAVGALGALPGVLAAAGGSIGTLVAGFNGIGGALKAYGQQQKALQTAGGQAQQNTRVNQAASLANTEAETARQNAQAIRTAQQSIAKARQEAARSAVDNARQVKQAQAGVVEAETRGAKDIQDAEDNLTQAQQRQREAQLAVSQARKDAAAQIEDLRRQLRGQRLDEEGASLSLEEAQQRLRQVLNDPGSTDLQRRQAQLAVAQAQNSLSDTQAQNKDLTKQYQDASKKGVEGSDAVVTAKQNEAAAAAETKKAEQDLTDTRIQAAKEVSKAESDLAQQILEANRARVDSLAAVKQAQQGLDDALKENELRNKRLAVQQNEVADSATNAASQTAAFDAAMKNLTPEAQAVVRQLIAMKSNLDTLQKIAQRGMLPGFLDFLKAVVPLFPQLNKFVRRASGDFGDFFHQIAQILRSQTFIEGFGEVLDSTNRIIKLWARGALNIGRVIGRITKAAIPLTEWLTKVAVGWTDSWEQMTRGEKGQKRLTAFFANTRKTLTLLGRILGNFAGALHTIGSVAADAIGYDLLNSLATTMEQFNAFTKSAAGRNAIAEWATAAGSTVKQLGGLFVDLVKAIGTIGKDVDFAGFVKQIRDELLPALVHLFTDLKPGDGMKQIIPILVKIIDGFDTLVKKLGGSEGILSLFSQLVDVFQAITRNIPAPVLKALLATMVIGRVSKFAGEITGLSGAFRMFTNKDSALRQSMELFKKWRGSADDAAKAAKRAGDTIKGSGSAPQRAAAKGPSRAQRVAGVAKGAAGKAGGAAKAGAGAATGAAKAAGQVGEGLLAGALQWLVANGPKVIGAVRGIALGVAAALAEVPVIGWIIAAIIAVLAIVLPLVIKHWDAIKGAFSAAIGFIVNLAEKVWGKLVDIFGGPFTVIGRIISFAFKTWLSIMKLGMDIILTFIQIAWGLFTLLVIRPVQAAFKLLQPIVAKIGSWIGKAFRGFVSALRIIWNATVELITWPFKAAYKLVVAAANAIGNWLKRQFRTFVTGLRIIWAVIKDNIIDPIRTALQPVITWANKIWNKIKEIFGPAVQWVGTQFAKIFNYIKQPFIDAWKGIQPYLDKIGSVISDAWDGIKNTLSKLGGWAKSAWTAFANAVGDPIDFVVGIINKGIIGPFRSLGEKAHVTALSSLQDIKWDRPKYGGKRSGGALGSHDGAGYIQGTKSPNRDNVVGVSAALGKPIVRVEPGEYVAPRWMSPIFPALESIRRTKQLPGRAVGGLLDTVRKRKRRRTDPMDGFDRGIDRLPGRKSGGLTQPINAPITNGLHDAFTGFPAVDAGASVGHTVVASAAGKVVTSKDLKGYEPRAPHGGLGYRSYGRFIQIQHDNFSSLYAHLSERLAKVGDTVKMGQQIGISGDTGYSFGPHLHYGSRGMDPTKPWQSGFGKIIDAIRGAVSSAAGWVSDQVSPITSKFKELTSGMASKIGNSPFAQAVGALPHMLLSGIVSWAKDKLLGSQDPPGAGAGRWAGTVRQALGIAGYPTSDAMVQAWVRQIGTESSGDPNRVQQIVDVNGSGENAGVGLVQVIPGTFAAYRDPSLPNDRKNPLANLVAGMNWEKHKKGGDWGAILADIGHGHGYAKGTTGASPGWRWVGENGPELMRFKGGEPVLDHQSSKVAARVLPGYDTGGVVRGFKPGANATWVQALRSQLMMGESKHWGSDLTRALKARDGIINAVTPGAFTAANGNRAAERVVNMIKRNLSADGKGGRRGSHFATWEWIAKQTGYDPSRLWRYWKWINPAVQHAKGIPTNVKKAVGRARGGFWTERAGWVKALQRELGMAQTGTWGSNLTAPLRHIVAHGFGWKVGTHGHQEWSPRPWKPWTSTELAKQAAENAIAEQTRSNQLNAEWDRLLKTLTGWGYSYAVRKLTDVGTADGMDIARGLVKNKSLAGKYNANAKVEYDRSDALSGNASTGSTDSQVMTILNALRTSPAGMGLTALAEKVSLSVDTTANLVKQINSGKKWADIPTNKRTRLLGDVNRFGNLFRFANGGVAGFSGMTPGTGNGDRVASLLTPGELVLRKAATAALIRDFGPSVAGALNNYDRLANGGFAATSMKGLSIPGLGAMPNYRGKGDIVQNKQVIYQFQTTVHNPIAEPAGVSVQKRVTRAAQLGILDRDS